MSDLKTIKELNRYLDSFLDLFPLNFGYFVWKTAEKSRFCEPENGKEPSIKAEKRRKGEGHCCIIYSHHFILTHAFVPSS